MKLVICMRCIQLVAANANTHISSYSILLAQNEIVRIVCALLKLDTKALKSKICPQSRSYVTCYICISKRAATVRRSKHKKGQTMYKVLLIESFAVDGADQTRRRSSAI